MKSVLLWLSGAVLVIIAASFYFRPHPGPQRIVVSPTITGVRDKYTYAWIIKTAHGAALVDTTADPRGKALFAELEAEKIDPADVHSIFLTHGHFDHWAAASLFPAAKIYVGKGDAALITGQAHPQAPGRWLIRWITPKGIAVPETLNELSGDLPNLAADGLHLQVVSVPGHTPGSVMYRVDDLLFTGDSLNGTEDGVVAAPWLFSDDLAQAKRSLEKLRIVEFRRVADGHFGLVENAKSKLLAMLAKAAN